MADTPERSSPPSVRSRGGDSSPYGADGRAQPANLADLLERVLDKGVVLAGDIRVNLLDIELLTIKIRLLLVSVDKAAEMGIDWWRTDPELSSEAKREQQALEREREDGQLRELEQENALLRERLEALEAAVGRDRLTEGDRDG
jgi:hypothetical protein